MVVTQTSFLRERPYLAAAITHFFVDVLNSSRTLLVAIIAVSLGLSNAQVGIALLLYNVGNALSQPLFGLLADRIGPRWLVVGGMGWMIFFFTLAGVMTDWPALIALTIAGLGSGAFHPTGAMIAGKVSDAHRSRATAVFFTAGQTGLFIGPILAGFVLDLYDRPGYLILPALSMIAFISSWRWINQRYYQPDPAPVAKKVALGDERPFTPQWRSIILLATIILTTSTVSIAATNFSPKLFTEIGLDPTYVGILASMLMMGSALGNVAGGFLADRIQGKWVIFLAVLGTMLPIYFYIPAEGLLRTLLLLGAGFFIGMPHSILVLTVQGLLPGRRALASGLVLGFMFFSGSVGSYLLGLIADQIGLAAALRGTAVLPLFAAAATLFLPQKQ